MKPKTFAIPLQKKGGNTHAPNCAHDYKAIREKAAPNPFGIKPFSEEENDDTKMLL